jgi:hypothetical protein
MTDAPVPLQTLFNVKEKAGGYGGLHINPMNLRKRLW